MFDKVLYMPLDENTYFFHLTNSSPVKAFTTNFFYILGNTSKRLRLVKGRHYIF